MRCAAMVDLEDGNTALLGSLVGVLRHLQTRNAALLD